MPSHLRAWRSHRRCPAPDVSRSFSIDTVAAGAPHAQRATNISSSGFLANWSPVSGATGYRLDVATQSDFNPDSLIVANRLVTGIASEVSTINAYRTYYYRVRAETSSGLSAYSNTITVNQYAAAQAAPPDSELKDLDGDGASDEIIPSGDNHKFFYYISYAWPVGGTVTFDDLDFGVNDYWAYGSNSDDSRTDVFNPYWHGSYSISYNLGVHARVSVEFVPNTVIGEQGYDYAIYSTTNNATSTGLDLVMAPYWFPNLKGPDPYRVEPMPKEWSLDELYNMSFRLVRMGKPIKDAQINVGGMPLTIGVAGGVLGTIGVPIPSVPGGASVSIGKGGGTGSVTVGGVTAVITGTGVSVGGGSTVSTGPIQVGPLSGEVDSTGVTIKVDPNGEILGMTVRVNRDGSGSITLSNGAGISVDASGRVSVQLPKDTPAGIVKVVDIIGTVLQAGRGAGISVKDIQGIFGLPGASIPLPGGDLGQVDARLKPDGTFQVGIKINDTTTFWFDVTSPKPQIAVDANRDGVIAFSDADATSQNAPYRFWLNDDDDTTNGSPQWSDLDPEFYPPRRPDSADRVITSARDCEDLTRLWLNLSGLTDNIKSTSSDLYVGLKWKNIGLTHPSIRLFRSADSSGGLGHIKDATIARLQANNLDSRRFDFCIVHADYTNLTLDPIESNPDIDQVAVGPDTRVADLVLPKSVFADLSENQPTAHLLFEGVQEGKGELTLVIVRKKSDGTWEKVSDGGSVWLQLDNIRRMYQRVHSTPVDDGFPLPWTQTSPPAEPYVEDTSTTGKPITIPLSKLEFAVGDTGSDDSNYSFVPSPDEQAKCVVFVHGILMSVPDQRGYSQSFFKRLWWEGYRGRFIAFRWNTTLFNELIDANTSIFNSGEYRSWKAGTSLNKFANALRDSNSSFFFKPNAVIGLVAHSLGNACATEALKQGAPFDSYIAMEAAISLSCFYPGSFYGDPQPPTVPRLTDAETQKPTPRYLVDGGYQGYLYDSPGIAAPRKVSYNNQNDFWLETGAAVGGFQVNWIRNQADFKPDDKLGLGQYTYSPPYLPYFMRGTSFSRSVTDPHESMSFASRSRTRALGAGAPGGSFGSTSSSSVNLAFSYQFAAARFDHSGQFQRNIQLMYGDDSGTQWRDSSTGQVLSLYRRLMRDLQIDQ